ncbi:hypothetical protein JQN72_09610 [Phycicoccus sp. CSK15P-2]|uniref:hypothetical protein n=1 Tax=Phycicoccus sp. CSK15P-2 TaxID=2807627 RepID=UPI001951CAB5|nr:hypothetical protein [Phycicoccus sp. CSK15P-2]MBM6404497.1 hypothetical protein [Phycicoccus sp. CSK15P-2]
MRTPSPPVSVAERRRRARGLASDHDGVLSRSLLRSVGVDHRMVRREVAAERWALHGVQTVAMTTGPLGDLARRWRGVWEVAAGVTAVDGVTALQHAGMVGYDDEQVHVSVRHTTEVVPVEGVTIHKVARRGGDEVVRAGLPRTRPAVAAVRAAHWAVSDRQAALLLAMPVQQRLCTGEQLVAAAREVRGRTRRALIPLLAGDIAGGSHSLGELDVVAACRRRGLPAPARQQVRHLPNGRAYLDMAWPEAKLAVEVDGAGHTWGLAPHDDALRQNAVLLGDELVLRVPVIGWRLTPDAYLDQICDAYRSRLALGSR